MTLTNITFDDDGKKEGEYFIQADSEGDGETVFGKETIGHGKIVQDAIIATYNGTGTITLGEGTVLKNYGGMSAVRLSDGELVMKSGSVIMDDEDLPPGQRVRLFKVRRPVFTVLPVLFGCKAVPLLWKRALR